MVPIAVVIANRNNARFLVKCLDSVLQQSLQAAEIVVCDDASTDHSLEVLAPYARDGAVKLFTCQRQVGVAACRHRAISHSSAKYVTTLDSDDFYASKDKLAAEAEVLRSRNRGTIAFSDVLQVDEAGTDIRRMSATRKIREGDLFFRILHLSGFIPRDYLVAREDYFAVGGFNTSLRIYEDWDLKIRLSRYCTWHYSGVLGTAYRQHPHGLSNAALPEHLTTMREIFSRNCPTRRSLPRAISLARFFFYHSIYLKRPAL